MRVVFDASFKTSSGNSLNDKLLVGPTIQDDLISIILKFRLWTFVMTSDIAMMFRQILIKPEDRYLQMICWREDSQQELKYYTLNTVTYGTSSAPYLAARTLKQLAEEEGARFPLAKRALERDFYMDDALTGADTVEEAIQLSKELQELLAIGGFKLRKWRASNPAILKHLQEGAETDELLIIDKEDRLKTLGLLWNARTDEIEYTVHVEEDRKVTKRKMLSRIATIFDPLGLVGPLIITAKIMLQSLWALQQDWDDVVPQAIYTRWIIFSKSLEEINNLKIPRNVQFGNVSDRVEVHGFCDASELAYGACLYIRSRNQVGEISSNLLCAKSKVAPLRTITLPRLELNGAVVLARLLETVKQALKDKIGSVYLWSDSTIVLAWIKTPPNQLKIYVGNRIAEIQRLCPQEQWQHVNGKENPADLVTRGIVAHELKESGLWWHGPRWLNSNQWPDQSRLQEFETLEEHKGKISLVVTPDINPLLSRYSSWKRLIRIISYIIRFIKGCRKRKENTNSNQSNQLSSKELDEARTKIIYLVQRETLPEEIKNLEKTHQVKPNSPLLKLNPWLDNGGMLRVGEDCFK